MHISIVHNCNVKVSHEHTTIYKIDPSLWLVHLLKWIENIFSFFFQAMRRECWTAPLSWLCIDETKNIPLEDTNNQWWAVLARSCECHDCPCQCWSPFSEHRLTVFFLFVHPTAPTSHFSSHPLTLIFTQHTHIFLELTLKKLFSFYCQLNCAKFNWISALQDCGWKEELRQHSNKFVPYMNICSELI